jgi:hypothetical protein
MKIVAYLFLLFGVLALGLGIAMLMDKTLLNQFSETMRGIFIGVLFGYGIYRVFTFVGALKRASAAKKTA